MTPDRDWMQLACPQVDAPCGSMAWMPMVLEQVPNITYTGIDVACNLITEHQVNFASRNNWRCVQQGR